MNETAQQTPTRIEAFPISSSIDAVRLFGCAEKSIDGFRRASRFWPKTTVNDAAGGIFETGDYQALNAGGFRVRIVFSESDHFAQIEIKGAGPYFTDLGVDQAMYDLKASIRQCLSNSNQ